MGHDLPHRLPARHGKPDVGVPGIATLGRLVTGATAPASRSARHDGVDSRRIARSHTAQSQPRRVRPATLSSVTIETPLICGG